MNVLARSLTALMAGLAFPAAAAAQDSWTSTTLTGAPTARYLHSTVWTGDRMIVWGGADPSAAITGTGSRYDPVANSWNPTSTAAAPSARYGHSAVWTGSRMIVWGGSTLNIGTHAGTNTGSSYDPASDTWTPISTIGAPTGRVFHVAVWTGREMLVWGGQENTVYFDTGGRYDPVTDSWSPMALAGVPLAAVLNRSAVWTGRELIVWGGRDPATAGELSTGGRYDPELDQWAPVSNAGSPQPRAFHSAVWTGREMLVWGGTSAASGGSGDSYDPVSNSWSPIPTVNAPVPRYLASAVWTGRGLLVFGGYTQGSGAVLDSGAIYDPVLTTWTAISTTGSSARAHHSAVWTGREMIVWGGLIDGGNALNTGGRYLPVASPIDSWSTISTTGAPTPRSGPSAVWTGREMLVWGGNVTFPLGPGKKYDPRADAWTTITFANAPSDRIHQTAVWTGREMIVWGGDDGGTLSTGARYTPQTDSWVPMTTTNRPTGRAYHSAVWTGRELIVWGGIDLASNVTVNDGARYDPRTDAWTPVTLTGAPSARQRHTAVWTGREMVVWGGESYFGGPTTFLNTGARYDPRSDTWSPLAATGAPAARSAHQAVWTGDRMILWGGIGSAGYVDTGGRYSPTLDNWIATSTSGAPVAREGFSAVWTGSEMILWGGATSTYEKTGARYLPGSDSWTSTTLTGAPEERHSHAAVWTGSRMLVWGGTTGTGPTSDTGGSYGGDTSGPTAGVVNDGLGGDLIVQIDTTSLSANWSGFADAESGIVRYEWALGTSPGATDIQAFVDVGTATSATASGLSLAVGTTAYATVRATNGDRRLVTASSNGVYVGGDLSADTGCGLLGLEAALVLLLFLRPRKP